MGNSLGQLPEGYSKAVHGPYDPSVFYGKKDVPLGQVNITGSSCSYQFVY